jgi:phosphoglycolate phosphatase-like HAD superfamily hydrolase
MGDQAVNDFPSIDLKKSLMIGDTNSDILFGKNLGMMTILVESKEIVTIQPDYKIQNLSELIF